MGTGDMGAWCKALCSTPSSWNSITHPLLGHPSKLSIHSSSAQISILTVSRPIPATEFPSGTPHCSCSNTHKLNSKGTLRLDIWKRFVHSLAHQSPESQGPQRRGYTGFIWLIMSVSSLLRGPLEKSFTKQRHSEAWSPNSEAMKNPLTSPPSLMLEQRPAIFQLLCVVPKKLWSSHCSAQGSHRGFCPCSRHHVLCSDSSNFPAVPSQMLSRRHVSLSSGI